MTNQLLESYIKNQIFYYDEIDYIFESILNKNNRIDENFLKNIKKFVSNTTPLEKILILAIGTTGILGTQIGKNTKLKPNEETAIVKTAKKINNPNRLPDGVKDSFTRRINNNDFKQLTNKELSAIKSVFGIDSNPINQENQENPLVLLFQELLSNSLNLSDDVYEELSLNKDDIEGDLGINKFDSLEEWSQNVISGKNDDVISFFRQPLNLEQSEDESDLFSQGGVYNVKPSEKKRIKDSVQEKINFLRTQNASDEIINLMTALGSLKICGALDGSDINEDMINRAKNEVGTEDLQNVLGKYVLNTAAAFTYFGDSDEYDDYEENLDY